MAGIRKPQPDDWKKEVDPDGLLTSMAKYGNEPLQSSAPGRDSLQLSRPEVSGLSETPSFSLSEPQLGDSIQTSAPGFAGEFSSQLNPSSIGGAAGSTDWGGVAGAGISAAGSMANMLAQVAGQKYQMDQASQQGNMNRALTDKLAKMQLSANQDQFARDQNLRGLMATLSANRGAIDTVGGGRNLRQGALEGMDQLLSKVMLRRS